MTEPVFFHVEIVNAKCDEAELINMMEQCVKFMKREGMSLEEVSRAVKLIADKHSTPVVNSYE